MNWSDQVITTMKNSIRDGDTFPLQIGLMAAFTWFAHFVASMKRYPNRTEFIGGILLAGCLGWIIAEFLTGMHADPAIAGGLGAFLGSGGVRTYEILGKKIDQKIDKE